MRTIPDIIEACGGYSALVEQARNDGMPLHDSTVRKWRENGIPEKHWAMVMAMTEVSPDALHKANTSLRDAKAGSAAA